MHLELSTNGALRAGCSGSRPANHTYNAFMLLLKPCNLLTEMDPDKQYCRKREISIEIKCVESSLQG